MINIEVGIRLSKGCKIVLRPSWHVWFDRNLDFGGDLQFFEEITLIAMFESCTLFNQGEKLQGVLAMEFIYLTVQQLT